MANLAGNHHHIALLGDGPPMLGDALNIIHQLIFLLRQFSTQTFVLTWTHVGAPVHTPNIFPDLNVWAGYLKHSSYANSHNSYFISQRPSFKAVLNRTALKDFSTPYLFVCSYAGFEVYTFCQIWMI